MRGLPPTGAPERQRLLDLSRRVRRPYAFAIGVVAVPLVSAGPLFGWLALAPLLAAVLVGIGVHLRVERAARPERLLLASAATGSVASLACIALAQGPGQYLFALPLVPLLGVAPIFSKRVTLTATALTAFGLTAVAFATQGALVRAEPPVLILPLMLLCVGILGAMASRDAEEVNRGTAVVDPLTGLLNRVALQTRAAELALQAASSGASVGLIVADLDHFKRVNDEHGHHAGDEVLVEVAARLRAVLGKDQPIFRFGGEEFVAIVPNTDRVTVIAMAERLRHAVEAESIAGLAITASCGVSLSIRGEGFDYASAFRAADAALYRSKADGRNRVSFSGATAAEDGDPAGLPALVPTPVVERRAAAAAELARAEARAAGLTVETVSPDDGFDVRLRGVDGNWLVADATERGHVVDLLERCARDSDANSFVSLVALVATGFWLHWWGLIPVVGAGILWKVCTSLMPRSARPEFAALGGLLAIIIAGAVSMPLADRPILYALPLGALVTFGSGATFRAAGAAVIGVVALISITLAALAMDATAVAATPFVLAFPLALIVATTSLGHAMGRSAREHRVASITDGLTGTLNRAALEARIPQLVQQSIEGHPGLALLVVDIDHFKRVNDDHGHDTGDNVLTEVSYRMRHALRAFDSVYRVGGEEFVIVLADITAPDATMVAERTRHAVEALPACGLDVTVSVGVAWAPAGTALDYDEAFALADERLYRAKRTGRNKVVDDETFGELTLLAA